MGRECAFTAKVVMLRGKPMDQPETTGIGDGQSLSRLAHLHQCPGTERPHAFRSRQIRTHHRRIIKIGEFMERLAIGSAVIGLMFLISWPPAFAAGLEDFKEAYPGVRIIATSAVVNRINIVYQEKIDKWKTILGTGATSHAVAIEKVDGNFIEFESSKIEVLKNIQGDTDENTMLWIPGQGILIAGDVLFNDMHVYTAETDSKARGKWLNSLQRIRELKPSVV